MNGERKLDITKCLYQGLRNQFDTHTVIHTGQLLSGFKHADLI